MILIFYVLAQPLRQNPRAPMFLYSDLPLGTELLASEILTATCMLIFFSLSLKQSFFFKISSEKQTFQ